MISSLSLDQHDFPAFLLKFVNGAKNSHVYVVDNLFAPGEVYLSLYLKLVPSLRWDG